MAIPIVHDAIEQGRYSLFSQALVASGHRLFFHAFKARKEEKAKRHEIDFLMERNGGLDTDRGQVPILPGTPFLDVFFEKYKDRKIEGHLYKRPSKGGKDLYGGVDREAKRISKKALHKGMPGIGIG